MQSWGALLYSNLMQQIQQHPAELPTMEHSFPI
jgi:hypothetical protein